MIVNSISFGAKVGSIPNLKTLSGKKVSLPELELSGYKALIGGDIFMPSCKIAKHDLLFDGSKIIAIDDFDENTINGKIDYIFLDEKTVTPAIFDEHIHGGFGVSFHDSSEEEIRVLLKKLAEKGVGAVLATTLPGNAEHIKKQIEIINNVIKNPDAGSAKIYGIHLEGPFLSSAKKGIHSEHDIMLPTIENYESFNPENVKMVTLAPELDEGYKLTKYLQEKGVVVSAGHSMATAEQMKESGIKHVTHLFNAMAPFHHRNATITNEGLLNPTIDAEMLADEATLLPQTMDMIMKLKPKDKLVFVSDALPNAGMNGNFVMNGKTIYVDENMVPKGEDGTLAGNLKFLPDIVQQFIKDTNLTFRNFIRYACVNPAKCFGLIDKFSIKTGLEPNFTVWNNKEIKPERTFVC